jgi:hypothetical protein
MQWDLHAVAFIVIVLIVGFVCYARGYSNGFDVGQKLGIGVGRLRQSVKDKTDGFEHDDAN